MTTSQRSTTYVWLIVGLGAAYFFDALEVVIDFRIAWWEDVLPEAKRTVEKTVQPFTD